MERSHKHCHCHNDMLYGSHYCWTLAQTSPRRSEFCSHNCWEDVAAALQSLVQPASSPGDLGILWIQCGSVLVASGPHRVQPPQRVPGLVSLSASDERDRGRRMLHSVPCPVCAPALTGLCQPQHADQHPIAECCPLQLWCVVQACSRSSPGRYCRPHSSRCQRRCLPCALAQARGCTGASASQTSHQTSHQSSQTSVWLRISQGASVRP